MKNFEEATGLDRRRLRDDKDCTLMFFNWSGISFGQKHMLSLTIRSSLKFTEQRCLLLGLYNIIKLTESRELVLPYIGATH